MSTVDRARLAELHARERAAFTAARPRSRALAEQAAAHMPGGVPMSWMVKWPGDFPVFVEHADGRALHLRRRHRPRRPLPRRHRRDDGPLPRTDRRGRDPAALARDHDDAAHRGRDRGVDGAGRALRPALLAVHADRHRRQPARDPLRPAPHRPQQGRRAQLVLPRLGRRGLRDAGPGRLDRSTGAATSAPRSTRRRRRASSSSTTSRRSSGPWPTATSRRSSSSPP